MNQNFFIQDSLMFSLIFFAFLLLLVDFYLRNKLKNEWFNSILNEISEKK